MNHNFKSLGSPFVISSSLISCEIKAGSRSCKNITWQTCLYVVCRQAYRTLRTLLGYDPTTVPAGQPGYGAGSGAPELMFGFLKHLWATQSRQDALQRCPVLPDDFSFLFFLLQYLMLSGLWSAL